MPVTVTSPSISPVLRVSCWPDEQELLLLQAGLAERSRALQSWNRFCGQIDDIEALSNDCYRLFPMVAANLKNQPDVLHGERLKSVLRHSWAGSQKLLADAMPALRALRQAGIDFMVLKGIALAPLHYKHWGLRPMADVDILVHPEDVSRTMEVLQQVGWQSLEPLDPVKMADRIRFRHEIVVKDAKKIEIDVHWHLSSECRHAETEDRFWRDAVTFSILGLETKTLEPADQLLHTCLHGVQWNEVSAVRWLVDAAVIIRQGIDWERLEQHARNFQRLEPIRETILFLADFGIAFPPGITERWQRLKTSRVEKLEAGYRAYRPSSRKRTRQLALAYIRLKQGESRTALWRDAAAYMQQIHHFKAYSRRIIFLGYLTRYSHLCSLND